MKIVHTEEQDSASERVSLAYLILGPTATFQIKCKKNEGSWFIVNEISLQRLCFIYGQL